MTLFGKELRGVTGGVLYLVFVAAVAAFYFSQYFAGVAWDIQQATAEPEISFLTEPAPGQESYGTAFTAGPELVMPRAVGALLDEYAENRYTTYPFGFYKAVTLNEAEQAVVRQIAETLTGEDFAALVALYEGYREQSLVYLPEQDRFQLAAGYDPAQAIPIAVSHSQFLAEMQRLDRLLGGGSSYAAEKLERLAYAPKTYEQALAEYNEFIYGDKITRGYARLFSDYMGIAIALFAVFLPVGFLLRDARAGAQQLVYSRRCGSAGLVCARYLACLVAVLLPVLLFALVSMAQLIPWVVARGFSVDFLAFFTYTGWWLLPTAMLCVSVGFFFTTLTGSPLGIAVQLVWSFLTLFGRELTGDWAGAMVLRQNSVRGRALVMENLGLLIRNRIGYAVLALVLLGCSIAFYELQRRGRLDAASWLRRRFGNRAKANPAAVGH